MSARDEVAAEIGRLRRMNTSLLEALRKIANGEWVGSDGKRYRTAEPSSVEQRIALAAIATAELRDKAAGGVWQPIETAPGSTPSPRDQASSAMLGDEIGACADLVRDMAADFQRHGSVEVIDAFKEIELAIRSRARSAGI